jgi:hypothetical protein
MLKKPKKNLQYKSIVKFEGKIGVFLSQNRGFRGGPKNPQKPRFSLKKDPPFYWSFTILFSLGF